MAKVFLFISIAVTALTAVLGYMTKAKVDSLQGDLKTSKVARADAEAKAAATTKELTTTKGELAKAAKDLEESKTAVTKLEGDVTAAKADAEKAKADVTAGAAKVAQLEKDLADAKSKTPGTPTSDPNEATRLAEELARLRPALAEKEKLAEAAQKREKEAEERLAAAEVTIKRYQEPQMRAGTSGRVVSVNSGWNFLITDIGDHKGATLNAPLLVMRGSQLVGRARITQVEPGTSVADIIPGSVPRGAAVQPGDKVVFAGRSNVTEKAAGGDAGAGKPGAAPAAGAGKAGAAPAPALPTQ
jgi:hypothetical protein